MIHGASYDVIAPVSILLIAVSFAALPKKTDSILLLAAGAVSLPLAQYMHCTETDFLFQETGIRVLAAVIYTAVYIRTKESYEEHQKSEKETVETNQAKEATLNLFATVIEERDLTSGQHVENVRKYTNIIARAVKEKFPEYGLSDEDVSDITRASILHDIGKVRIPDAILQKKASLTEDEAEIMKEYTHFGYDILQEIPAGLIEAGCHARACEIAICHHERVDGTGYPLGLKEDNIPVSAQIVALADSYEALTHERPYKKAYDSDTAIRMITEGECGKFSNRMISCLKECRGELLSLSPRKRNE